MSTNENMSLVDYVLSHKVKRSGGNSRYYNDLIGVVKIASLTYHFLDTDTRRKVVDKIIEIGRAIPDYESYVDEFEEYVDHMEEIRIKPAHWKSLS